MAIKTPFSEMLKIDYPIIVAPMFLVSNVDMVVAGSEAGALGTFPALNYRPVEKFHEAVREIKKRTNKPFGVNIIVNESNKFRKEHMRIVLEEGVAFVITSLGNPSDFIKDFHKNGGKVFCDVINKKHAQKAAQAGADGLIAVASGAGGHGGNIHPYPLVPYLKEATGLPVVLGGCISRGRELAASLAIGADGVHIGTRFIASSESPAAEAYKRAILSSTPEDIKSYSTVDGFPGNFIRNSKLDDFENGLVGKLQQIKSLNKTVSKLLAIRAFVASDHSKFTYKTVFGAGQGVGQINDILSTKVIIEQMIQEYELTRKGLPANS